MMVKEFTLSSNDDVSLLTHVLECDLKAITTILDQLGSTNSHRCKLIQHTIHEFNDPLIWTHLLHYLADHRWDDQVSDQRQTDPFRLERIDQAIIEVFTQDQNDQEYAVKCPILHEFLETGEMNTCFAAAYLLGLRYDPRSIPILSEIIDKGNQKWKLRAIKALAMMQDEDCARPLMKALTTEQGKLHREARRALQNLGSLARSVWLDALDHPDHHIRWEAALGLGRIGDHRAAPTLAEGLFDESYVIRWSTANVLSQLGERGIPAVLSILSKRKMEEPFRQAAYQALHGIESLEIRKQIMPVLDAISNPSPKEPVSSVAQNLLLDWKNRIDYRKY